MKYRIKVYYSTGDSFQNYDTDSYIELEWNDIEIAKENLKAIKAHYEMYTAAEKSYVPRKERKEIDYSKNWWFVNEPKLYCISSGGPIEEKYKKTVGEGNWEYRPDEYYANHTMYLKTDKGKLMRIGCFWCGYF